MGPHKKYIILKIFPLYVQPAKLMANDPPSTTDPLTTIGAGLVIVIPFNSKTLFAFSLSVLEGERQVWRESGGGRAEVVHARRARGRARMELGG
jgi:hypothetical protein